MPVAYIIHTSISGFPSSSWLLVVIEVVASIVFTLFGWSREEVVIGVPFMVVVTVMVVWCSFVLYVHSIRYSVVRISPPGS